MYILIRSENGTLSGDNEVLAFRHERDAFNAMVNGVQTALKDEYDADFEYDEMGFPMLEDSDNSLYSIDGRHAYIGPYDGPEWQIYDVPTAISI